MQENDDINEDESVEDESNVFFDELIKILIWVAIFLLGCRVVSSISEFICHKVTFL